MNDFGKYRGFLLYTDDMGFNFLGRNSHSS